MLVTQGANYAFHALMQMARASLGQTATIEEMAGAVGASPSYMAKLMQRLTRAGLVTSQRGRGGGYLLARPASQITLWEVTTALQENSVAEMPLLPSCLTCPLSSACPLKGALETAARRVEQVLRKVNVASVAEMIAGRGTL